MDNASKRKCWGGEEMSTTAEQCVLGPHVTLRILPPHLDP